MNRSSATARFVSWTGGCVLIGRSVAIIPEHAHYAIQLAISASSGIRFQTEDSWTEYRGAIVPSRQPHAMDATDVDLGAVLLVEPDTALGRAITARYAQHAISAIPDQILDAFAPQLFSAARERDDALLIDICQQLVQSLTSGTPLPMVTDARVERAIAHIKANLHTSLTLDDVAQEVCLSPSRFRHLFVAETGMALRPFVLWRRLLFVWELLAGGASLSRAAHEAGFADAAHLSRTSRTMFGFPPSALQIEHPVIAPVGRRMLTTATSVVSTTHATVRSRRTHDRRLLALAHAHCDPRAETDTLIDAH